MRFERKYTSKLKRVVHWLFYSSFGFYFLAIVTELLVGSKGDDQSRLVSGPAFLTGLMGALATLLLVFLLFSYIALIFVEKFERPKLKKTQINT